MKKAICIVASVASSVSVLKSTPPSVARPRLAYSLFQRTVTLVVFLSLFLSLPATASQTFQSGPEQSVLIELYTSEGCASCPPADEWMTDLTKSPYLWKTFVPVAYHIDYWDYLGWKDKLSQKYFSERQRAYASQNKSGSVYTPMIVNNGSELKEWYLTPTIKVKSKKDAGMLKVDVVSPEELKITYLPHNGAYMEGLVVYVAKLGFDYKSQIEGGENKGQMINHNFAVLSLAQQDLQYKNGMLSATARFEKELPVTIPKQGVAVWVSKKDSYEPIQATGGYLESAA